jgi:hypothetical protein
LFSFFNCIGGIGRNQKTITVKSTGDCTNPAFLISGSIKQISGVSTSNSNSSILIYPFRTLCDFSLANVALHFEFGGIHWFILLVIFQFNRNKKLNQYVLSF